MWLLDKLLRRLVRRGELVVTDHDGKIYRYGAPDPGRAALAVRLTDRGAAFKIARDPRVGAGEAYMDGRLVVEQGDIRELIDLLRRNAPWERSGIIKPKSPLRRAAQSAMGRIDRVNWQRRSKRNAAHSYEISSRLFELFLDRDLQYTMGYWTGDTDDLDTAQQHKMAHIAAKLDLRPGQRLLDIGCGWGGFALYLHRTTGADVLGIALAEEQIRVARARAAAEGVSDRVKFELIDYRNLEGRFDRITVVGMLEHVGPPQYPGFFRKCRDLLAPDGVMLVHTIGRIGKPGVTDRWTSKYIFPGGYIPALSEIVSATEKQRLIVSDVETLRLHYVPTLEHWYKRTEAARDEIVALYDERFFRMWQFYLAGSEAAFRHGGMANFQVQLIRDRHALPITRDYMAEAETRLRAL